MQTTEIETIVHHHREICNFIPLHPIRDEREYDHAIHVLNELLDAGGANENNPLARLVTLLGHCIGDYERIHHRMDDVVH